MPLVQKNIGSEINVVQAIVPTANYGMAALISGSAIDRSNYQSCVAQFQVSGTFVTTPTSWLATPVLLHATTSAATFFTAFATCSQVATTGTFNYQLDVNLAGAYQYIKLYIPTPTVTGTANLHVSGTIVLGGATSIPV